MNARLWRRVNGILDEAERLPASDREEFVRHACQGDAALEREVRGLLDTMERGDSRFLVDEADPRPEEPTREEVESTVHALGGAAEADAPVAPYLIKGSDIVGEFELLRKLGEGQSGEVYEAVQSRLGRKIALKIVRGSSVADIERMRREAELLGQLDHPGIAAVYDFGEAGDGCWIALELIRGHDLGKEITWQNGGDLHGANPILPGPDDSEFVRSRVRLVREVARAMHVAHRANITHRDVKPENIVLTPKGEPKLVDFGLARTPHSQAVTQPGAVAGTVPYMSLEHLRGAELDERADVHSLGVVLFQLLTGRLPIPGSNAVKLAETLEKRRVPTLREVDRRLPRDLEAICAKATEVERGRRYATALELADDLDRFLSLRSVKAGQMTPGYHIGRWIRRHRKALAAAAGTLVAATLVGVVVWLSSQQEVRDRLLRAATTIAETRTGSAAPSALVPVRQMLSDSEEHDGLAHRGTARSLRESVEAVGRDEKEEAETLIEGYLGRGGYEPIDERGLLAALERLRIANALIGNDVDQDPNHFPRVSLTTDRPGDLVRFHPADLLSGDFEASASVAADAPLDGEPVAPGYYRVVVERPGVGFAELTRWLGEWGRSYDLGRVDVLPTASVVQDMVPHPAGSQRLYLPIYPEGRREERVFEHGAFYLDAHEVTNAEYMRFVDAMDDPTYLPQGWERLAEDPRWSVRPVAGVSYESAKAYAEWCGKRLPTELEWERAAFGKEERPFPWGDDASRVQELPVALANTSPDSEHRVDTFQRYLEHTRPVMETPIDRTPEGVFDLAGNVSEWTDSMAMGEVDGRLYPVVPRRRTKGWNWQAKHPPELHSYVEVQMAAHDFPPTRGFRCAKSAP